MHEFQQFISGKGDARAILELCKEDNHLDLESYVMDFFAISTLQTQTFERVGPPPVKSWAMY